MVVPLILRTTELDFTVVLASLIPHLRVALGRTWSSFSGGSAKLKYGGAAELTW
jgi:hypothetical protein